MNKLNTTRFGYHKHGNCWNFIPSLTKYSSGKLWWFSFWRFYFVWDRRQGIKDIMGIEL